MSERVARLHRAGLKATGPRMVILSALEQDHGHPTAEQLYESLSSVLQGVQQQFLNPNLVYGGLSPIDKYLDSLVQAMDEHIQAIVAQKSEEAQAELARTDESTRLDEQQRQAQAEQVQQQIAEWESIGTSMRSLMVDLQAVDQAPAPAVALAPGV